MFGSGAVGQAVWNTLRTRPAIQAALLNPAPGSKLRLKNLAAMPQGSELPFAIHYAESGTYSGPFGDTATVGEPTEEVVRYVVRFICAGESDGPIRPAAKDALTALVVESPEVTVTQDDGDYSVTFLASGEWPLTTVVEGGIFYRQLGFVLTCHVFRL